MWTIIESSTYSVKLLSSLNNSLQNKSQAGFCCQDTVTFVKSSLKLHHRTNSFTGLSRFMKSRRYCWGGEHLPLAVIPVFTDLLSFLGCTIFIVLWVVLFCACFSGTVFAELTVFYWTIMASTSMSSGDPVLSQWLKTMFCSLLTSTMNPSFKSTKSDCKYKQ